MKENKKKLSQAMLFIILFGIVSLFSDMTHEGASSIRGAYLSLLGASAATIGFVSGLGELTLGLDELALGEYDGGSGDAVAAAGIAAIEDGIADEVEARFGITVGVSVIAVCESDVYSVDSVLLSLPAEADEAAVCDYVRYISGCGRVEVTR